MDEPGVWLFRVGPLKDGAENIEEPDQTSSSEDAAEQISCATKGRYQCHSSAHCSDENRGFCCYCNDGFYGNGYNCIKNDVPIRVTGKITGNLAGQPLDFPLQSYVVMQDGRTYTAITSVGKEIESKLKLMPVLGSAIGWLFAKPLGSMLNGYQVIFLKFNFLKFLS